MSHPNPAEYIFDCCLCGALFHAEWHECTDIVTCPCGGQNETDNDMGKPVTVKLVGVGAPGAVKA